MLFFLSYLLSRPLGNARFSRAPSLKCIASNATAPLPLKNTNEASRANRIGSRVIEIYNEKPVKLN